MIFVRRSHYQTLRELGGDQKKVDAKKTRRQWFLEKDSEFTSILILLWKRQWSFHSFGLKQSIKNSFLSLSKVISFLWMQFWRRKTMGLELDQVASNKKHYGAFVCRICKGLASLDAVVTPCNHPFCHSCLISYGEQCLSENSTCQCPTCGQDLKANESNDKRTILSPE